MIHLGMYTFFYLWRHGYRMSTALQLEFCSASNNSSRGYYVFIFQARLKFFTLGLPIIWRAIWLHLSHPRRTKAKVSSSPVTTPHSLFQTLVRSLYHLVLAMFLISMMLCCFLKSVSQKIWSVGQLFDDRQSYAIFTPTSSVLSRIYTRIMS